MSLKHDIEFKLNGVRRSATVRVDMSALDMLREVVLTGAKYGCGEASAARAPSWPTAYRSTPASCLRWTATAATW
jgi:hypothetical protein